MYNKAIVSFVSPFILGALAFVGIKPETTVEEAITILITLALSTALVYIVPNKKV